MWSRTFYDGQGNKTTAKKSVAFSAFLRVPQSATLSILKGALAGVFPEPRGKQPGEHDPKYKVIWLAGCGHAEALHLSKTCSHALCLAKIRGKFGDRVKNEDQSAAWAILKPGVEFVDLEMTSIYELFPIPHGTQRQAVTKLLSDWGWNARALQPSSGNVSHMSWRVGAAQPPPAQVLQGFGVEIVISQVKDLKKDIPQPKLIASTKTQKHLRGHPSKAPKPDSGEDPWANYANGQPVDPWARKGRLTVNVPPTASTAGKSSLTEIREQLCQEVTSKVRKELEDHAVAMDTSDGSQMTPDHEVRFKALEVGLNEVRGQNTQFIQWFSKAGKKMKVTEQAIGDIQQTFNIQQQEISTLGTSVQSSLAGIRDDFSSAMAKGFADQMNRIETLLKKRPQPES